MVIYADVLVLLNLYVNYFLLLATEKICKTPLKFWRRLLGAAVGALGALYILLPQGNAALSAAVKLLISLLIVAAAFGFGSAKRFLRSTAVFYAATFAFAGVMMALWFTFKPSGMAVNNSVVYFNVSPMLLVVSTVVCYAAVALIRRLSGRKNRSDDVIHTLEITHGNTSVSINALLDTGHSLHDLFSDRPVIVVDMYVIKSLLPSSCVPALATASEPPDSLKGNYYLVPYSVVSGGGIMPAFKPDKVLIDGRAELQNVLIGASTTPISGDCHALINEEILMQMKGE